MRSFLSSNRHFNFKGIKIFLKNPIFLITFFYTLSYALLAINWGIYWDDWVNYNQAPNTLRELAIQLGAFPKSALYIAELILPLENSILAFHLFIFLIYLSLSYLFYILLGFFSFIFSQTDRTLISIAFAVFPINFARVSFSTFGYGYCFLLFVSAWICLLYWKNSHFLKWPYRIISPILFFLSYQTNSLLPMMLIVFLSKLLIQLNNDNLITELSFNLKNIIRITLPKAVTIFKNYIDVWLSVFIYWYIKKTYYRPTQLYTDYQKFDFDILNFMKSFKQGFGEFFLDGPKYLLKSTFASPSYLLLLILISFLTFKLLSHLYDHRSQTSLTLKYKRKTILTGFTIWLFSTLPYILIGKTPTFQSWDTRLQLLQGIGGSIILYSSIQYASPFFLKAIKRISKCNLAINEISVTKYMFMFVIALFITINIQNYYRLLIDNLKMEALTQNIKDSSKRIEKYNLIFVHDNVSFLNAMNRDIQFYEYTGLFKRALKDESKLVISAHHLEIQNVNVMEGLIKYPQYNCKDFSYQNISPVNFIIKPGDRNFSPVAVFRLVLEYFFSREQFYNRIKNFIKIDLSPMISVINPLQTLKSNLSRKKLICQKDTELRSKKQ